MRPELYIFAKRPGMGVAKTRLARDIGPTQAQRINRAMSAQVMRNGRDPRWDSFLYVTPQSAIGTVPAWRGWPQVPQPKGSLSPRLAQVFSGRRRPVIVIGTDCPQIRASDISDAIKALRTAPFVFGPASDGGFWLMAAMAPLKADIFNGIRWSTEHTLSDLQARLNGPVATLRTLSDVDDLDGLRAWKAAN